MNTPSRHKITRSTPPATRPPELPPLGNNAGSGNVASECLDSDQGGSGDVDNLPVTAAVAAAAINGGAALNARGVGSGSVDHDDTSNRKDNTVTTRAPTSTAGAAAAPPLRLRRCRRHSTAAAIAVLSVVIIIIN